jgi:hypothetical protein
MPRPWHKSLLFHLGLPAFLFLLWAWADSNFRGTTFLKISGTPHLVHIQVIDHSRGALRLAYQRLELLHAIFTARSDFGRTAVSKEAREWFPAPAIQISRQTTSETADYQREIKTESLLILPHWLLVLLYLTLWSLAFLYRHRRLKRFLTRSHSPPAQPLSDLDLGT